MMQTSFFKTQFLTYFTQASQISHNHPSYGCTLLTGNAIPILILLLLLIRLFSCMVIQLKYSKPHGAAKNTHDWVKKLQYSGLNYVFFFP